LFLENALGSCTGKPAGKLWRELCQQAFHFDVNIRAKTAALKGKATNAVNLLNA
jgi:hypothetical protein